MSEQATLWEPVKKARRAKTKPAAIAQTISRLADWYAVNKPGLKSITISSQDAWSLREHWKTKDAKCNGEKECRAIGFHIDQSGNISWRSFDLVEQKG